MSTAKKRSMFYTFCLTKFMLMVILNDRRKCCYVKINTTQLNFKCEGGSFPLREFRSSACFSPCALFVDYKENNKIFGD